MTLKEIVFFSAISISSIPFSSACGWSGSVNELKHLLENTLSKTIATAIEDQKDLNTFKPYAKKPGEYNDPKKNWTILEVVTDYGFDGLAEKILKNKVNCNVYNPETYETPLNIAAHKGYSNLVQLLLEYGAHPDGNPDGIAPLVSSIQGQFCIPIIQKLIKYGANPYIKKRAFDQIPLDIAQKDRNQLVLVSVILDALHTKNFYGFKKYVQEKIMPTISIIKKPELMINQLNNDTMMHLRAPAFKYLCN